MNQDVVQRASDLPIPGQGASGDKPDQNKSGKIKKTKTQKTSSGGTSGTQPEPSGSQSQSPSLVEAAVARAAESGSVVHVDHQPGPGNVPGNPEAALELLGNTLGNAGTPGGSSAPWSVGSFEELLAQQLQQQWLWMQQLRPQFQDFGNYVPGGFPAGDLPVYWAEEEQDTVRQGTHEMSDKEEEIQEVEAQAQVADKPEKGDDPAGTGELGELVQEKLTKTKEANRRAADLPKGWLTF